MDVKFEPEKKEAIYIRINEKTKEHLDNLAKKYDSNLSEVARKLILDGLNKLERK